MARPSDLPDWATDTDFGAGGDPWNGQVNKVKPSSGQIAEGFVPASPFEAEWENWLLHTHGLWIDYLDGSLAGLFGDGSHGALTFDGTNDYPSVAVKAGSIYTLQNDVYATDLTVTGAAVRIKMNGFRVFVRGTLTTDSTGAKFTADGLAASGATAGAAAPVSATTMLATGSAGGNGGSAGANGSNGVDISEQALLGSGGGSGGNGSGGFVGGTPGTFTNYYGIVRNYSGPATMGYVLIPAGPVAFRGGSGGSGGGANAAGTAGGGGGGGGILAIAARRIVFSSASAFSAAGGAGGNAAGGNCGGGGGGGGGGAILVALSFEGTFANLTGANCCPGGAGGTKTGSGTNGGVGGDGYCYALSLGG